MPAAIFCFLRANGKLKLKARIHRLTCFAHVDIYAIFRRHWPVYAARRPSPERNRTQFMSHRAAASDCRHHHCAPLDLNAISTPLISMEIQCKPEDRRNLSFPPIRSITFSFVRHDNTKGSYGFYRKAVKPIIDDGIDPTRSNYRTPG